MLQPGKADECLVDHRPCGRFGLRPVALLLEPRSGGRDQAEKVELRRGGFQREVQVLRKTRQAIQEAQGRSSHERQRCPCAALLETLQDPRLQILPHDVHPVAGSRSLHDFAQVLFHRSWYSSASTRATSPLWPAVRRRNTRTYERVPARNRAKSGSPRRGEHHAGVSAGEDPGGSPRERRMGIAGVHGRNVPALPVSPAAFFGGFGLRAGNPRSGVRLSRPDRARSNAVPEGGLPDGGQSVHKVEVDTRPPAGAGLEVTTVRRHATLRLAHHDKPSLLADKVAALLCRDWIKGRDVYDLAWYLSDPTWPEPNEVLLTNTLQQSGPAHLAVEVAGWKSALVHRLSEAPWEGVKTDVERFLERPAEAWMVEREAVLDIMAQRGWRE